MSHDSYIIAGPTASGKSDFAHALARRVGGVVINCDSVQVYKGIENISASPLAEFSECGFQSAVNDKENIDKSIAIGGVAAENRTLKTENYIEGVSYRLFSILPLSEQLSVAQYLELARVERDAAISSGKPAVFVGGTGFYINAILSGISPVPEISKENRERARAMVREYPDAAKQLLINADPKLDSFDPQRMARALEVFLETGRPLGEWQSLPRRGAVSPSAMKILISPHRDTLAVRIAERVPQMIENGALEEAQAALAAGWDTGRAIGADEAAKFIRGEIGERQMVQNWITRTNQYAKRQRTWFRHQFAPDIEIMRVPVEKDLELVLGK